MRSSTRRTGCHSPLPSKTAVARVRWTRCRAAGRGARSSSAGCSMRRFAVTDGSGRRTSVLERRFVSMADPHLGAIEIAPHRRELVRPPRGPRRHRRHGDRDDETDRGATPRRPHLELLEAGADEPDCVYLVVRTVQSQVTPRARRSVPRVTGGSADVRWSALTRPGVGSRFSLDLAEGQRMRCEKVVALYTSRDAAISDPLEAARARLSSGAGEFAELLADARSRVGTDLEPCRDRGARRDDGDPAPHQPPSLPRPAGRFAPRRRSRRRDPGAGGCTARAISAMSSGTSCSSSRSSTCASLASPARSSPTASTASTPPEQRGGRGSPGGDVPVAERERRARRDAPSALQPALGTLDGGPLALPAPCRPGGRLQLLAVLPGDRRHRAPLRSRRSRSSSRSPASSPTSHSFDEALGRYRIRGVMGPDEFHDGYPWSDEPGVDDNAYTNVMTAWLLERSLELVDLARRSGRTSRSSGSASDERRARAFRGVSRATPRAVHRRRPRAVRRLRPPRAARPRRLPRPLRRHRPARPHLGGGGRHGPPLSGGQAARRADDPLTCSPPRSCAGSRPPRLLLRRRRDPTNDRLLHRPRHPRLLALARRPRLDHRPPRPALLVAIPVRSARIRTCSTSIGARRARASTSARWRARSTSSSAAIPASSSAREPCGSIPLCPTNSPRSTFG